MIAWLVPALAQAAPLLAQPTLTRGLETTLSVSGATPGDALQVLASTTGTGAGPCLPLPGHPCLDLLAPVLLGSAVADASGQASLAGRVPVQLPLGTPVHLQALETGATVATSAPVTALVAEIPLAAVPCTDPGPDAKVVREVPMIMSTFEGRALVSYVPSNPQGLILYFLGGDDVLGEVSGDEHLAFLWNLMAGREHFAVAAVGRESPGRGASWTWEEPYNQNPDAQRVNRLRNWMIANTAVEATTPVVTMGFSDGASMATAMAEMANINLHWPIRAVLAHNGAGGTMPDVPTELWSAEHDLDNATAAIDVAVDELRRQGTPYDRVDYAERTLTETALGRHASITASDASALFADMVAYGLVDASGARLVSDGDLSDALDAWSAQSALPDAGLANERTRVVWATHRVSAIDAPRECQWVLDHL